MGLTRTSEPANMAISLPAAAKACEIGEGDSAHDQHLTDLIMGAVRDVERYTRRALITQTWKLTLPGFCRRRIELPRPPLQSVTSIAYVDEAGASQTVSSFQVSSAASPGYIEPAYNDVWPATRPSTVDAVTITYVAGFGDDESDVPDEYQRLLAEMVVFGFTAGRGDMPSMDLPKHVRWRLDALRCGVTHEFYGVRS